MHFLWLLSFLLFFLPQSAFAEQKTLAVLEFVGVNISDNNMLTLLNNAVRNGLTKNIDKNEYLVMARESTLELVKNNRKDDSCTTTECEVELARNIGTDFVIAGNVTFLSNLYTVTLTLHETTSLSLIASEQIKNKDFTQIIEQTTSLGERLMAQGFVKNIKPSSVGQGIDQNQETKSEIPFVENTNQSTNGKKIKGNGYEAVLIPSGTFSMGCTKGDSSCRSDEKPVHKVTLSKPFYMMTTEVTQGLYLNVMGTNPSSFPTCGLNCPVETVTWYDAVRMANKLSEQEGLTPCYQIESGEEPVVSWTNNSCNGWRLPTEAEWEYAARGGKSYKYSGSDYVGDVAWFSGNTHAVGQREPNDYGLYDMSGNVWEWVWDWKGGYGVLAIESPIGPNKGSLRVRRGGGCDYFPHTLRVSMRNDYAPSKTLNHLGFRFSRTN